MGPSRSGFARTTCRSSWGLYSRTYPYVRETVVREFDSWAMPAPYAMVELTTALLGVNTLLLGAAELALAPTLYDRWCPQWAPGCRCMGYPVLQAEPARR